MLNPAWVVAAISAGGVVAMGAIAWSNANRVEGIEARTRALESKVAVLEALAAQHGREVERDR